MTPVPPTDTPRAWPERTRVRAFVELFALCGFAFTQPLLDIFGRGVEQFAFRGASPSQIVLFGVAVTVLPALGLAWIPDSQFFWAVVALALVYTAYVSQVYRAGIESVHPSQAAAARSLGLSHGQSLRYVVLPQAVRRVIPPLLNDFIGLQKDTALVGTLGVVEAFRQSQIDQAATFNGTYYLVAATLFVAITIPLARFTDWLVARDRRRQQAGRLA